MSDYYLNPGLPQPAATPLDEPYWQGLKQERLLIQRCNACQKFQWGAEWICHHCLSDDLAFTEVPAQGVIYSYERVWHPVHPALKDQGPYIVVLVELPEADQVRMVGNLLGDPERDVPIGAAVTGVYEHHADVEEPFTLLHWRLND